MKCRALIAVACLSGSAMAQPTPTPEKPGEQDTSLPPQGTGENGATATDTAARGASPAWLEERAWTIRFEPAAWFAGLSGDVTLPRSSPAPGGNPSTDLNDLNLDSSSVFVPLGEATVRRDRWGFTFRGFAFSTDRSAEGVPGQVGDVPIGAGDDVRASADLLALELEGLYTLYRDARRPMNHGGYYLRPRLDLVYGMRLMSTDWRIENRSLTTPASAEADETFVHPLVGAKLTMVFREQFTIDAMITAGGLPLGDQSSYGFDILVGGTWQPIPNVGVQIGYRALFVGMSSGSDDEEFEYNGAVQGLYAGVVLEF